MPLPPALAARLARRGILTEERRENANDEEIIAESYDKPSEGIIDKNIDEFGNPLPPPWEKVWEPEFETWYYWETNSDKVSWLPPNDPESVITYSRGKGVQLKAPSEKSRNRVTEKRSSQKAEKRKMRIEEEFDPMDPSSYSDAPKGDWSAGLKKVNDAKTGVDSTANGPLFQQRPYPSPGEVLSRNKMASRDFGPIKP